MNNKLYLGFFVILLVVLFIMASSFDTQLLQAGIIH